MDYQEEYIKKNPNMHLEDAEMKVRQVSLVIPENLKIRSLLDVACGAGSITTMLVKQLKPTHALGIDISKAMINKAKELDKERTVEWKASDVFKYKNTKLFDLVLCVDILEHIDDDLKFLKKVSEFGRFILVKTPLERSVFSTLLKNLGILDPWKDTEMRYGHVHHYDENELNSLFQKANLRIVNSISVPMPKRTKFRWEIFRLLFYPISIFSMKRMVEVSGGFKIVLLKTPKF